MDPKFQRQPMFMFILVAGVLGGSAANNFHVRVKTLRKNLGESDTWFIWMFLNTGVQTERPLAQQLPITSNHLHDLGIPYFKNHPHFPKCCERPSFPPSAASFPATEPDDLLIGFLGLEEPHQEEWKWLTSKRSTQTNLNPLQNQT